MSGNARTHGLVVAGLLVLLTSSGPAGGTAGESSRDIRPAPTGTVGPGEHIVPPTHQPIDTGPYNGCANLQQQLAEARAAGGGLVACIVVGSSP